VVPNLDPSELTLLVVIPHDPYYNTALLSALLKQAQQGGEGSLYNEMELPPYKAVGTALRFNNIEVVAALVYCRPNVNNTGSKIPPNPIIFYQS